MFDSIPKIYYKSYHKFKNKSSILPLFDEVNELSVEMKKTFPEEK